MRQTTTFVLMVGVSLLAVGGCGSVPTKPANPNSSATTDRDGGQEEDHPAGGGQFDMSKMKAKMAKLSAENAASAEKQHVCPVKKVVGSVVHDAAHNPTKDAASFGDQLPRIIVGIAHVASIGHQVNDHFRQPKQIATVFEPVRPRMLGSVNARRRSEILEQITAEKHAALRAARRSVRVDASQ